MSAKDEYKDGLTELESELGQTFTWHNINYPCVAGGDARHSEFDSAMGGLVRRDSTSIIVRAGLFPVNNQPVTRDLVTFRSRKYRIESIRRAPDYTFNVYTLGDPNE